MKLENVLIIEDNTTLRDDVVREFEEHGVQIKQISDIDELDRCLAFPQPFQMVILDWLLDGDSSTLAQLCLTKIRQAYFVPVVIWTEELSIFEEELEDVKQRFPEACLKWFSKGDVRYDDLLETVNNWYINPPLSFAQQFRRGVAFSIEKALYDLAEHSLDDLATGLKTLIALEKGKVVDIEHVGDVLMRLVSRAFYQDREFVNEFRKIIESVQIEDLPASVNKRREISSQIEELHMYYQPDDNDLIVRTGDIVEVLTGSSNRKMRGIIITPACDLAVPRRTMFLRIALIHEAANPDERKGKKADKWPLKEGGMVYVVCHHEILALKNVTLAEDGNLLSVMSYDQEYATIPGEKIELKRIKRLDDPYRADLLHHFISHAGRIGTPDFTAGTH